MAKLSLNSISSDVFKVRACDVADGSAARAEIIAEGRTLYYEYAKKGKNALNSAMGINDPMTAVMSATEYSALNRVFQEEHLLYAAKKYCEFTGEKAPETFEQFKAMSQRFYGNGQFYAVLQGIYREVITPILPRVYSEAVSMFADVVEVDFGESYQLTVGSNDIPIFQDSAWGAARSVPANRFYDKDYTLVPSPKTAEIRMKWHQLVGNGIDFGRFFANITAGLYAKTMGMWNEAITTASANTALIPTGLSQTFNSTNWVTLANKIAAVNNTTISNVIATGNAVALSKVLPTNVTGSTNVNMDAAIATLLGADFTTSPYLGEFMSVRLIPMTDAVVPGTQNGNVTTILPSDKIWMMAGNGRKPLTIAYNSNTPIGITIDPKMTSSFEMIFNLTIALDSVAVFSSKVGLMTI